MKKHKIVKYNEAGKTYLEVTYGRNRLLFSDTPVKGTFFEAKRKLECQGLRPATLPELATLLYLTDKYKEDNVPSCGFSLIEEALQNEGIWGFTGIYNHLYCTGNMPIYHVYPEDERYLFIQDNPQTHSNGIIMNPKPVLEMVLKKCEDYFNNVENKDAIKNPALFQILNRGVLQDGIRYTYWKNDYVSLAGRDAGKKLERYMENCNNPRGNESSLRDFSEKKMGGISREMVFLPVITSETESYREWIVPPDCYTYTDDQGRDRRYESGGKYKDVTTHSRNLFFDHQGPSRFGIYPYNRRADECCYGKQSIRSLIGVKATNKKTKLQINVPCLERSQFY